MKIRQKIDGFLDCYFISMYLSTNIGDKIQNRKNGGILDIFTHEEFVSYSLIIPVFLPLF